MTARPLVSTVLGTVVVVLGAIVLAAWASGLPGIHPIAALAFVLMGVAIMLHARGAAPWARVIRRGAALGTFVISVLTLLDLGAHLAPVTALGLVTGAAAFLLLDIGRAGALGQILALATGTLGFFHLVGYAYRLDRLGEMAQYAVVELHTALPLVLMSAGLLLARPDRGLMRLAHADTRAGVVVRRLLPVVIAAPFVVGWVADAGRRAGLYGPEFAMAVSAVGTVVALAGVVWAAAAALQRADVGRRRAETALQRADAEVGRVAARTAELTDANKVLVEMASRLRTLERLNRLVSSSLDFEAVLVAIARAACDITTTPVVSFWLVDEETQKLTVGAWSDAAVGADFPYTRLRFGEGAVGMVASTRQPVHIPDVFATSASIRAHEWCTRHDLRSFYGVPVLAQDRLLAVLALSRHTPLALGGEEQELLGSFVAQAAVAIDNARLFAEAQLRRRVAEAAETRYRELFDRNLAGILRASRDGRILDCNAAVVQILGYASRAEVLALRVEDLYVDPAERATVRLPQVAGERLSNAELRWRRADGTPIAVLVNVAATPDPDAGVVLEGIIVDITDRERATAAEAEADTLRAVAKLAHAAAHEINNPLAVILAHLDLLARRYAGDPETMQRVDRARVACRRIAEMIVHMGRITRLEVAEQSDNLPPILDLRRSSSEAGSS